MSISISIVASWIIIGWVIRCDFTWGFWSLLLGYLQYLSLSICLVLSYLLIAGDNDITGARSATILLTIRHVIIHVTSILYFTLCILLLLLLLNTIRKLIIVWSRWWVGTAWDPLWVWINAFLLSFWGREDLLLLQLLELLLFPSFGLVHGVSLLVEYTVHHLQLVLLVEQDVAAGRRVVHWLTPTYIVSILLK